VLYRLARFLQVLGMLIVPLALAGNLAQAAGAPINLDVKQMLMLAGLGILIFYIGHALQQRTRP
jgi:hypothetical protein